MALHDIGLNLTIHIALPSGQSSEFFGSKWLFNENIVNQPMHLCAVWRKKPVLLILVVSQLHATGRNTGVHSFYLLNRTVVLHTIKLCAWSHSQSLGNSRELVCKPKQTATVSQRQPGVRKAFLKWIFSQTEQFWRLKLTKLRVFHSSHINHMLERLSGREAHRR